MFGKGPMKRDNSRYYEILGVSKTTSLDALKKAYKKAAMKNHPDKGGDPEKFMEMAQAYMVLSDPEKREAYDRYGEDVFEEGMKDSDGGGHDPDDIFRALFDIDSFEGDSGRDRRKRRGKDTIHPLKVSMEDIYLGTLKKFSFSRNVICSECKGKGVKSRATVKCSGCQGTGRKTTVTHEGFTRFIRKHLCDDCDGTEETVRDEDLCTQCKGEKVVPEEKVLEVVVEKGAPNGQRITFRGEADEAPRTLPGDVHIILLQEEHRKFKRKGNDLVFEQTLSLVEALCGFQFVFVHLDGRKLLIKSNPGKLVKHDSFKAINYEGMPVHQRPSTKGKLYIHLTVQFPDSLSLEQIKALEAILPPKPSTQTTGTELEECEETTMHDAIIEDDIQRKQSAWFE